MDVSIIIVNYNTRTITNNCISSILEHTVGINYEIILVDNNSTDGSKELFQSDKRVVFIKSSANIGFGRANNLGYAQAKGKYLFFLNSDTLLKNNAIKLFYYSMENMPLTVACLGCILRDKDAKPTNSFGCFPKWHDEFTGRTKKVLSQKEVASFPAAVDYITGAALFIRKKVADKEKLFDPDFFLYYEETEMQKRYQRAGYKSVIIDGPLICHLEGASSSYSFLKIFIITQSYFIYLKKDMKKNAYIFFRILVFIKRGLLLWRKDWSRDEKKKYLNLLLKL